VDGRAKDLEPRPEIAAGLKPLPKDLSVAFERRDEPVLDGIIILLIGIVLNNYLNFYGDLQ